MVYIGLARLRTVAKCHLACEDIDRRRKAYDVLQGVKYFTGRETGRRTSSQWAPCQENTGGEASFVRAYASSQFQHYSSYWFSQSASHRSYDIVSFVDFAAPNTQADKLVDLQESYTAIIGFATKRINTPTRMTSQFRIVEHIVNCSHTRIRRTSTDDLSSGR